MFLPFLVVLDGLADTVFKQFKTQSPIGKVVYDARYKQVLPELLDNYIKDFVYLSHPCYSTNEHWVSYFTQSVGGGLSIMISNVM